MAEQAPIPQPDTRFGDVGESRFYQFSTEIHLAGDPETPEDFARAQHYLETITEYLIEFGPVWEKKPQDIVYELDYHNAWHQHEVEQERRGGDRTSEYREITLQQLRALSKRRLLAFEESGWEVTQAYRVVNFFDKLIEEAMLEQEEMETQMAISQQGREGSFTPAAKQIEELPF